MATGKTSFIKIPEEAEQILGKRDPGTRTWRRTGKESDFPIWLEAVIKYAGHVLSPGELCIYANVSRNGVHQRIGAAKLTALVFDATHEDNSGRRLRQASVICIPLSECRQWMQERNQNLLEALKADKELLEQEKEQRDQENERLRKAVHLLKAKIPDSDPYGEYPEAEPTQEEQEIENLLRPIDSVPVAHPPEKVLADQIAAERSTMKKAKLAKQNKEK